MSPDVSVKDIERKKECPSFYYLYSKDYKKYAQDPFNDRHYSNIYKEFTFKQFRPGQNKKKNVSPPYPNTHKSVAVDPYRRNDSTKSTLL